MRVNFSMININEKTKVIKKGLISHLKSFFIQECFKNAIIFWLLILTLIANLANWLILKLLIQPVGFPIILHYNVYFGVDLKGSYWQVFSIPLVGLFLFLAARVSIDAVRCDRERTDVLAAGRFAQFRVAREVANEHRSVQGSRHKKNA